MREFLAYTRVALKEVKRSFRFAKEDETFRQSRLEASIVRQVHSIEKGLSISAPRLGFGLAKLSKLFSDIEAYQALETDDLECLKFARDAVKAYLDFHEKKKFQSEKIEEVAKKYEALKASLKEDNESFGGVKVLNFSDLDYDVAEIEKLFLTRSSVRDFSGEPVDEEVIQKAILLAQRSPSACNRQGVRIYSIDARQYMKESGASLEGIGGFADAADRFLLITAKRSAYAINETNQHVVSASMFGAYLTLALHTYHVAACTVQRSLMPSPVWSNLQKIHNIPEDEQIVMMLAVGNFRESALVPESKRFSLNKIYRNLSK